MARLADRTGWLSLPEAAEAVHVTLPTLRYLVRRLGFALGAAQDDRGDTYLPAARLDDLRLVIRYRAQGLGLDQIEKRLLAQDGDALEPRRRQPVRTRSDRPAPTSRPSRLPDPTYEHSLPFPFAPVAPAGGSRRSRPHGPIGRHELPFPADDLRQELAALRQENRELRERLDELVAWLRARESAPVDGTSGRGSRPLRESERDPGARDFEPSPAGRQVAVASAGPPDRLPEGTRLTRTPAGNLRPAVVRNWHPPALNGRR